MLMMMMMMMMMSISLFGQVGCGMWATSQGDETYSHQPHTTLHRGFLAIHFLTMDRPITQEEQQWHTWGWSHHMAPLGVASSSLHQGTSSTQAPFREADDGNTTLFASLILMVSPAATARALPTFESM